MLAGPQSIDRIIRTGTVVLTGFRSAYRDTILALRLRIGYQKFGENRFVANVFKPKYLLAAELPAQTDLPLLDIHALGLSCTRDFRCLSLFLFAQYLPAVCFSFDFFLFHLVIFPLPEIFMPEHFLPIEKNYAVELLLLQILLV